MKNTAVFWEISPILPPPQERLYILGAELAESASWENLEAAYGIFKKEATSVNPEYQPATVNSVGWLSTQTAWGKLFPSIALIACFLLVFIGIRDRSRKKNSKKYLNPLQPGFGIVTRLNLGLPFPKEFEGLKSGVISLSLKYRRSSWKKLKTEK